MANKKISDLTLRSGADDTIQFAVDDATQTWRVTAAQLLAYMFGTSANVDAANLKATVFTGMTANTSPLHADTVPTFSSGSAANRKVTRSDFLAPKVVSKTANYTVTDEDDIILVDGSAGGFTITLQSALVRKRPLVIQRTDNTLANQVTIATTLSQTIDGASSKKLYTINESWRLVSDGANFRSIDHKTSTPWTQFTMTIGASTTAPTKGTTSTDKAYWRRNGANIEVHYEYAQTGAGSAGSGQYRFPVPTGTTIDMTMFDSTNAGSSPSNVVGGYHAYSGTSGENSFGKVQVGGSSYVVLQGMDAGTSTAVVSFGSANLGLDKASIGYSFTYSAPVTGWDA